MTLSCSWDDEPYEWTESPDDFVAMPELPRRKRCCACHKMLSPGEDVLIFPHFRVVKSDIEESIYGDAKPLANLYHCEKCGEIYLNLEALGYCVWPPLVLDLIQEYWELTGFDPEKYKETI